MINDNARIPVCAKVAPSKRSIIEHRNWEDLGLGPFPTKNMLVWKTSVMFYLSYIAAHLT